MASRLVKTAVIDPRYTCYKMEIRESRIHRLGVYALERIPARRKVIEYTGEKISRRETKRRGDGPFTYLFTLDKYWTIDGAVGGSGAEIINHSCDPNLRTVILKGHILYVSTPPHPQRRGTHRGLLLLRQVRPRQVQMRVENLPRHYQQEGRVAFPTAIRNPASSASGVIPAQCGVITTFDSAVNGCPGGKGSTANTSRPAPAICPDVRASSIAASSTIAPRAVFTRIADRFISPNSRTPTKPVVSGDSRRWTLTTSLDRYNSASSTIGSPSFGCMVQAITRMPKPDAEPRELAADRAESDDPARLPMELDRLPARPAARARRGIDLRDPARNRQQQRQRVLRDRDRRDAGRIPHGHAVERG